MSRGLKTSASLISTLILVAPAFAAAQIPSEDLRTLIQASVLSDPRATSIPPAQLQGLVDALLSEAQAKNMTSGDILWRPNQSANVSYSQSGDEMSVQSGACAIGWQGYLCNFNKVFGFEGGNYQIPLFMLFVTAFLLAVVWEMILHHRKKLAKPGPRM
jgi:hypothetical protein